MHPVYLERLGKGFSREEIAEAIEKQAKVAYEQIMEGIEKLKRQNKIVKGSQYVLLFRQWEV